jgi:hypothetical protein
LINEYQEKIDERKNKEGRENVGYIESLHWDAF